LLNIVLSFLPSFSGWFFDEADNNSNYLEWQAPDEPTSALACQGPRSSGWDNEKIHRVSLQRAAVTLEWGGLSLVSIRLEAPLH
jgi:hypothetical protein